MLDPAAIDPHLVTLVSLTSLEAEHYRGLGHQIDQMNKNSGLHVMAVSSPTVGDGKTTTVLNLVGILARMMHMHVLLVDMDLRRPSVLAYLGLSQRNHAGLVEAILDPNLSLLDVVTVCKPFNISLLPAGRISASSYELLQSPRVGELLAEARKSYDCIIIDTPPLIPLSDYRFIETWIDGLLLVVGAHKTPRKLVDAALAIVEPSKLVGLIFNRDERIVRGYYSYYYSSCTMPTKAG
jgi:capsular exopolysaccharide synthesis family protein